MIWWVLAGLALAAIGGGVYYLLTCDWPFESK